VAGWSDLWLGAQRALGLTPPPSWLSASLLSFVAAAAVAAALAPQDRRAVRRSAERTAR
jgi:hypothetical protein